MEAVNDLERQSEINHNQKHVTNSGNCHSNWASKDSGNGSEDMNDVDILQHGGTGAHLSSVNELSGDGKMKHKQNTSSSSVACNGIEPGIMPCNSSSSNCSGSLSWVKPTASRIERQDWVDIPLPQENIGSFLQTPTVISSCQTGSSDAQGGGFSVHSTDTFKSTPEGIPSHENAGEKYLDIKVNHSHVTVGDSQNINMNHSHVAGGQDINMNHSHVAGGQDTSVNHSNLAVMESENINMNHSYVMDSQDINVKHSHLAIKDSEDIRVNHTHVPEEDIVTDSIQRLAHQSHYGASSSELLNKFYEGSNVSAVGLYHGHIPRCLSAPSSSANMSHQPPEFMSLPVSPVDMVPKHIMDSLGRELLRERFKVNMLQEENNLLTKKVAELEGNCLQRRELIKYYVNQLEKQQHNVLSVKKRADDWQGKYNAKDKDLSTAHQHIHDLSEYCKHLGDQIINLNTDLRKEKNKNKTLNDRMCNLDRILKQERDRFTRDDECSKEKIKELKQTNQWIKEQLAEYIHYPMSVTPEHSSASRRSHTDTESDGSQSHETRLKGV